MDILQQRAREAIKQHGGLRAAARALGINHASLLHMSEGKKKTATEKVLKKLGLTRAVTAIR